MQIKLLQQQQQHTVLATRSKTVTQWCSHSFSMRASYNMNKSKWSTCYKNAKHLFIKKYIENSFCNVCWCILHTHMSSYSTTQHNTAQWRLYFFRHVRPLALNWWRVGSDMSVHRSRRCLTGDLPQHIWDRLADRDRHIEHPCRNISPQLTTNIWHLDKIWIMTKARTIQCCDSFLKP